MKGRPITYSEAELAFIQSVSTWPRAEAHTAFCQKFGRNDVSFRSFSALCRRKRWMTGRPGRFVKGQVPFNKGKPCPPGASGRHPNARRTQFAKGERNGAAKAHLKPLGHERVTRDGYLERKVSDEGKMRERWRCVQLLHWEAVNGPLPAGYVLKCLDGDKLNTDPSNWEAIPRGVLSRLNGGPHKRRLAFDAAAPEIKPTLMAMARLEHRAAEVKHARRRSCDG